MARKYIVETFGCQMNVHDSERIAGLLEHAGFEAVNSADEADIVVLNTCSVREHAAEKLFSRLGQLRRAASPDRLVVVAGCVAQQEGESIVRRVPSVDVVVGTRSVRRLPILIELAETTGLPQVDIEPHDDVSFPLGLARRGDPVRASVTVLEGCNDFCSFCVVPYTRGHERMRLKQDILAEVREAVDGGRSEIHLLGQIVNHYQAPDDGLCDFPALLEAVSGVPGVRRIRFASPHPRHVSDRLIDAIRDLPAVCKHLHLPVQSGSTRVLAAMRRRHTREEFLDLVDRIRRAIPEIALSTDMIVGFPRETAADFEDTLTLTEASRFHSMFSFKYSVRPNTLAAKRMPDDVPEAEKGRRLAVLQELQKGIQWDLHRSSIGHEVEVLAESQSRRRGSELSGRTTGNTVVNFPGPPEWQGRLVRVRIRRAGPNSLWGEASGLVS